MNAITLHVWAEALRRPDIFPEGDGSHLRTDGQPADDGATRERTFSALGVATTLYAEAHPDWEVNKWERITDDGARVWDYAYGPRADYLGGALPVDVQDWLGIPHRDPIITANLITVATAWKIGWGFTEIADEIERMIPVWADGQLVP